VQDAEQAPLAVDDGVLGVGRIALLLDYLDLGFGKFQPLIFSL